VHSGARNGESHRRLLYRLSGERIFSSAAGFDPVSREFIKVWFPANDQLPEQCPKSSLLFEKYKVLAEQSLRLIHL